MPNLSEFRNLMKYYCDDASVGYDQSQRWNVYDGGETDCSALVISCLKQAGFDTGNATYTGNMSNELCSRGWSRLAPDISYAQPGDILLNDANHVAAVVDGSGWNATIAQASIDENGNISGGAAGDQTGWETATMPIYSYPWDCILRYAGNDAYGWIKDDKGWWYKRPDGSYPADQWYWVDADNAWYFFDAQGYAVEGWLLWNSEYYFLEHGTCKMKTGWLWWEEHWYYLRKDGTMVANRFELIDDKWYGFDHDGEMITKPSQIKINAKQGSITFRS